MAVKIMRSYGGVKILLAPPNVSFYSPQRVKQKSSVNAKRRQKYRFNPIVIDPQFRMRGGVDFTNTLRLIAPRLLRSRGSWNAHNQIQIVLLWLESKNTIETSKYHFSTFQEICKNRSNSGILSSLLLGGCFYPTELSILAKRILWHQGFRALIRRKWP